MSPSCVVGATRAYMAERQQANVAPLPLTGGTAEAMAQWIDEGVAQEREGADTLMRVNLVAKRCPWHRAMSWSRPVTWRSVPPLERTGLGGALPVHTAQQAAGLEKCLVEAEHKPAAFTPARGRANERTDEVTLVEAIARVLQEQQAGGLADRGRERQGEQQLHYVSRGRGRVACTAGA